LDLDPHPDDTERVAMQFVDAALMRR